MKNITIKVFGNRETIEIAANNDYETVFNEVEKALRNLYEISNFRRRHGNQCFGFDVSEGENRLLFGIGLSADRSGKIIWETKYGFDHIARGTTKYSRYVDGAFWHMASMIINHFGLTDQISEEDKEWNDIVDLSEYQSDQMAELESTIEDSVECLNENIEHAKQYVDYYLFPYEDLDIIDDELVNDWIDDAVYEIKSDLKTISEARGKFLMNMSRYTKCNYTLSDAYADCPEINLPPYYATLDDFDAAEAYKEIIDYIFSSATEGYDGSENMLSLRDKYYNSAA